IWNRRHFDVQIDAIQKRPAHFRKISLNDPRSAAALARRIAIEAARVRIRILALIAKSRLYCRNPISESLPSP
ncbi:MAG TPA: hypothetical protein VLI55_12415, partial [Bryobacteraceae bacterium]|nr:hypothetical protein [Bryobacteraceae bacterium]